MVKVSGAVHAPKGHIPGGRVVGRSSTLPRKYSTKKERDPLKKKGISIGIPLLEKEHQ